MVFTFGSQGPHLSAVFVVEEYLVCDVVQNQYHSYLLRILHIPDPLIVVLTVNTLLRRSESP